MHRPYIVVVVLIVVVHVAIVHVHVPGVVRIVRIRSTGPVVVGLNFLSIHFVAKKAPSAGNPFSRYAGLYNLCPMGGIDAQ